jgi:hypothetical protein
VVGWTLRVIIDLSLSARALWPSTRGRTCAGRLGAGVDCLLLSAWPIDEIFFLKARSHAAIHNYWLSLSVPVQCAALMPSAIIGPDGSESASVHAPEELATATLDRDAPEFHIAVNLARPWRAEADQGDIYRRRRVDDPRSDDRTVV